MTINQTLHRPLLLGVLLTLAGVLFAASASAATATVASITLTTPSKSLLIGTHETIKATAKDIHGHAISGITFTWTTSKKTAVTITSRGVATAHAAGSAKITVTAKGKTATVTIKVPTPTTLGGVAAQGTALASKEVDLVDKRGNTLTTTTDGDGNYTLDTTGLTPPFLIAVHVDDTHTLYSVSADAEHASVINVTPLTDLIIRSWYSVQGLDVGTDGFANPVANPPPSPTEVTLISNVVVQVTALWLQQAGVDTSSFNPISTPFTADGTGVDQVLDQTQVNTDTGTITITDGGDLSQTSDVSYNPDTGAITVDTTTTNGTDSSSSSTGTVVATTDDMTTALAGITTVLTNFANTVNTKGKALKASDLTPYLDKNLLSEGLNRSQFAGSNADQFNGDSDTDPITISFQVQSIPSLDTVNGLAAVDFAFTQHQGDNSDTQQVEFFFKQQSDGTWRFYGDQMPAKLSVSAEMRTNQGANTDTNGPDINADIRPLTGLYSGISINGGGVFTNQAFEKQGTEDDTYTPDPASPGTTVPLIRDQFFTKSPVLENLIPAGTELTVTMTPAAEGSSPQQYTVKTNAFTTESISITNLTGSALADATLGTPLHVEWTLPKTFAIAEVKLEGFSDTDPGQGDDQQCKADKPVLSITSTSGDITLPAGTCLGSPITGASINLEVIGVNGERELVIYMFQDPTP